LHAYQSGVSDPDRLFEECERVAFPIRVDPCTLMAEVDKTENDWQRIFQVQVDIAGIKRKVVIAILADGGAPMKPIARLSRDVEALGRQFDRLFLEVSEALDLEHPLIDEALVIEDMWSKMSVDLADRLKEKSARPTLRLVTSRVDW
jgi:hypothetical protein